MLSWDRDQETATDAKRLLMPSPKVVFIARFEVPTEPAFCGWPEHKIQHGFATEGVRGHAVFCRVNPLRPNPSHELHLFRERPRFFKQKVDIPFCRVTPEERRDSSLELQPIFYRRNFNRDRGAEARSAFCDAPVGCAPQLNNGGGLLLNLLREGLSGAEKRECQQDRFGSAHDVLSRVYAIGNVNRPFRSLTL